MGFAANRHGSATLRRLTFARTNVPPLGAAPHVTMSPKTDPAGHVPRAPNKLAKFLGELTMWAQNEL